MVGGYVVAEAVVVVATSSAASSLIGAGVLTPALRLLIACAVGQRTVEQPLERSPALRVRTVGEAGLGAAHPLEASRRCTRDGVIGLSSATTSIEVMMLRRFAMRAPYSGQC